MKRLLLFASGASWRDIADLPVEQVRYVSVGAAVLVTSVFASLSLCLLLSTVFGLPAAAFIPLGAFWGLAIFNLDRWIVSTVHYGKARDPDDAARGSKVISKLRGWAKFADAVIVLCYEARVRAAAGFVRQSGWRSGRDSPYPKVGD
ncbi:MAG: DUF4407 domain-containing protein [Acidimicrobiia bacterium]